MSEPSSSKASSTRLLTAKQVAELLGCSLGNVYGLLESGQLPRVRIGTQKGYRIAESDLATFIQERKSSPPSSKTKSGAARVLKHIRM